MQQGHKRFKNIQRNLLIAFVGCVDAVFLHGAGSSVDIFEQEGNERDFILVRQHGIGLVELLDVVGAIVRRKRDSGEHDFCSCFEQRRDDLVEVLARYCYRQATQTVIAAEFDNNNLRMEGEHVFQALNAVFCSIAVDALVHDAIRVATAVEIALQVVWICLACGNAVACGERIAEADDDGAAMSSFCLGGTVELERNSETKRKKKQESVSARHTVIVIRDRSRE